MLTSSSQVAVTSSAESERHLLGEPVEGPSHPGREIIGPERPLTVTAPKFSPPSADARMLPESSVPSIGWTATLDEPQHIVVPVFPGGVPCGAAACRGSGVQRNAARLATGARCVGNGRFTRAVRRRSWIGRRSAATTQAGSGYALELHPTCRCVSVESGPRHEPNPSRRRSSPRAATNPASR